MAPIPPDRAPEETRETLAPLLASPTDLRAEIVDVSSLGQADVVDPAVLDVVVAHGLPTPGASNVCPRAEVPVPPGTDPG